MAMSDSQTAIFWGRRKRGVVSGSNSFLSISNCYFHNNAEGENLEPVITINNGRIQLTGCSFETNSDRDHLKINQGVDGAIITCNNAKNTNSGSGFRYIIDGIIPGLIIDNNE